METRVFAFWVLCDGKDPFGFIGFRRSAFTHRTILTGVNNSTALTVTVVVEGPRADELK